MDLFVGRSGANTVYEIGVLKKYALLAGLKKNIFPMIITGIVLVGVYLSSFFIFKNSDALKLTLSIVSFFSL